MGRGEGGGKGRAGGGRKGVMVGKIVVVGGERGG